MAYTSFYVLILNKPEDIAEAIQLLVTDEARYLTGNYLAVGGSSYLP